jgi:hypothetical protein
MSDNVEDLSVVAAYMQKLKDEHEAPMKALKGPGPACGKRIENCGGSCFRTVGHEPPCLCEGDGGTVDSCPM